MKNKVLALLILVTLVNVPFILNKILFKNIKVFIIINIILLTLSMIYYLIKKIYTIKVSMVLTVLLYKYILYIEDSFPAKVAYNKIISLNYNEIIKPYNKIGILSWNLESFINDSSLFIEIFMLQKRSLLDKYEKLAISYISLVNNI